MLQFLHWQACLGNLACQGRWWRRSVAKHISACNRCMYIVHPKQNHIQVLGLFHDLRCAFTYFPQQKDAGNYICSIYEATASDNSWPRVGDCGWGDVWPLTHRGRVEPKTGASLTPVTAALTSRQKNLFQSSQCWCLLVVSTPPNRLDDNLGRVLSTNRPSILLLNMTLSTFVVWSIRPLV